MGKNPQPGDRQRIEPFQTVVRVEIRESAGRIPAGGISRGADTMREKFSGVFFQIILDFFFPIVFNINLDKMETFQGDRVPGEHRSIKITGENYECKGAKIKVLQLFCQVWRVFKLPDGIYYHWGIGFLFFKYWII
ncbi:MAG: hypothetical protein KAW12_14655 [Candidatus Aminicenantes bacterium]|nr:hypothetical protein [Candidatus Aminicenantes bacterium]